MIRKIAFSCALAALAFAFIAVAAFAGEATVEIPVTVEGGGTVQTIAFVNCPQPENGNLTVSDGETGEVRIKFEQPGAYKYLLQMTRADSERVWAPDNYQASVTVTLRDDGTLSASTVITAYNSITKSDVAVFYLTNEPPTTPPPPTTGYTPPNDNPPGENSPGSPPPDQPQTGDASNLNRYIILAIAASAGLFILSSVYAKNTKKLVSGA